MCFQDREEDSLFSQEGIDSGVISALWKPKALHLPTEDLLVVFQTDLYLRSYCGFVYRKQWKIGVRGGGCHEIHFPELLEAPERIQEILRVTIHESLAYAYKKRTVHSCERMKRLVGSRTSFFLFGEFDRLLQPSEISRLQKRIAEHGRECGADGKCQSEVDAVFDELLQDEE
jgi:hypothetical protein